MFNALLRVPTLFFTTNPIGKSILLLLHIHHHLNIAHVQITILGRVVNRFSKDISSIDEQLCDVTHSFADVRRFSL
jgi:hypothetical protein